MNSLSAFENESIYNVYLHDAYEECWWRLIDALSDLSEEELDKLSNPFLVKPLPAYCKANKKVLFVGQETSGWESFRNTLQHFHSPDTEHTRDQIIEYLQWMYEDLRFNRKWDNTPFWRGVLRLYTAISPGNGDDGFLNTQLVRFDLNHTRPPERLEALLQ